MATKQHVDVEQGSDNTPPHTPRVLATAGIANPAPLGLFAFGLTTVMLMYADTTWANGTVWVSSVSAYAMFYGGFAQFVAGTFEMIKGNTFAATAFSSYGAFWMGFFLRTWFARTTTIAPTYQGNDLVANCLFYVLWGVLTTIFFIPTLRKNGCLAVVFGTLAVTFYLLAGGVYNHTCSIVAGYFGFVCGLSAIYAAAAEIWHENLGIIMPGLRPIRLI